jgi:hypothetical protein
MKQHTQVIIILWFISPNVPAVTDGFLCPIRKMRSILRAQKNVAETKRTKGFSPTAFCVA